MQGSHWGLPLLGKCWTDKLCSSLAQPANHFFKLSMADSPESRTSSHRWSVSAGVFWYCRGFLRCWLAIVSSQTPCLTFSISSGSTVVNTASKCRSKNQAPFLLYGPIRPGPTPASCHPLPPLLRACLIVGYLMTDASPIYAEVCLPPSWH